MMKITLLFTIIMTTFLLFLHRGGEAVVPCSTVDMKAAACVTYATGKAPSPSAACCSGLKGLAMTVKSVDDKKAICRCMKAAAKSFTGMQDRFLAQIPAVCNIKVGFPISTNVNCETIH